MKNLGNRIYGATLLAMLTAFACSALFAETDAVPGPAVVPVAEPAAPPHWAEQIIVAAEKLPVVGPIVSKVLLWSGILAGILTTLTAALLGAVRLLMTAANLAGLARMAEALVSFQNGKVMYWLKFFSMFNAKKPESHPKVS